MKRLIFPIIIACLSFAWLALFQFSPADASAKPDNFDLLAARATAVKKTFNIEGQQRTALIYPNSQPAPASGAPLIFFFHGHGGTAMASARKHQIQNFWPEAVVVYMQGLPGVVTMEDPNGEKNGWQRDPGALNDRDIKFVDAALAEIQQEYKTDARRVYAMGFSNGGRFTYLLWNMRGEKFAAFTMASSQGMSLIETSQPKPIFISAGEKDTRVPFEIQLSSIEQVSKLLQTDHSQAVKMGLITVEPGINGTELAVYQHPGGHQLPQQAVALAVKFFQRH